MGDNAHIVSMHYLDCGGGLIMGDDSWLTGIRSTVLSHVFDPEKGGLILESVVNREGGHWSSTCGTPPSGVVHRRGSPARSGLDRVDRPADRRRPSARWGARPVPQARDIEPSLYDRRRYQPVLDHAARIPGDSVPPVPRRRMRKMTDLSGLDPGNDPGPPRADGHGRQGRCPRLPPPRRRPSSSTRCTPPSCPPCSRTSSARTRSRKGRCPRPWPRSWRSTAQPNRPVPRSRPRGTEPAGTSWSIAAMPVASSWCTTATSQ